MIINEFILVDPLFCRYHQPSIILPPSSDLQKATATAAEFSVIIFCYLNRLEN